MNISIKILVVVFISISMKHISADIESAQDQTKSVTSGGVVRVSVNHSLNPPVKGMGFFVDPHTLVTTFYNIRRLMLGKVSDHISIVHPKTEALIPVDSIKAVDFVNDLAVLHISEYKSPVYYPIESFEDSTKALPSSSAYIVNHGGKISSTFVGRLSPQYLSEDTFLKTLTLSPLYQGNLDDLDGSPVFSMDDKIIGVTTGQEWSPLYTRALFSDAQAVKKLLLKPSLNCKEALCLHSEIERQNNALVANEYTEYQQGIYEGYHMLSLENEVDDEINQADVKGQKGVMLYWFRRSAKKGFLPAMRQLAKLYLDRFDDEVKFKEWITKAAERNAGYAQLDLSMFLLDVTGGVDKSDLDEGIRWAQKAIENGYFLHTLVLFNLFSEKIITMKEYLDYIEDFSKRGHSGAQVVLAHHLFTGDEVDVDTNKAMELLLRATEANNPIAFHYLYLVYAKGLYGETKDLAKARRFKQQAVNFGYLDMKDRLMSQVTMNFNSLVSNFTQTCKQLFE